MSISETKFRAYVGLEMAMSIDSYNDISDYWKTNMFSGHNDFKAAMSRDDFNRIRSNIVLHPEETIIHDVRSSDPLWHSRKMIQIFQKNCSQIAVPVGTSALDENTARTKARTCTRSYMPNKPDPYCIRFYAVVGWNPGTYLFSISDNRSGNRTGETAAEAYCNVFPEMRTPYNKHLVNSKVVDH